MAENQIMELNEKNVKELNDQIGTLERQTDKTSEETKTLGELREKRASSFGGRIRELNEARKNEEAARLAIQEENTKLKERLDILEATKVEPAPVVSEETVVHESKKFFTDKALQSKIVAGQMTNDDAYKHQRERERAEDREIVRNENKTQSEKLSAENEKIADAKIVVKKYPHFLQKLSDGKPNPSFKPDDPVYKETIRLIGLGVSKLSTAVAEAEKNMKGIKKPDLSEEFGLHSPSVTSTLTNKDDKEVTLTQYEGDSALSQWTAVVNPATGRFYTDKEAIIKAKKAKASRQRGK